MQFGVSITDDVSVIAHDDHRFSSPRHSHHQAQLLYAVGGVISLTTDRGTWVVPPSRAVWLPPNLEHVTTSHTSVRFRSLLIEAESNAALPKDCMVVEVTPLLRELILRLAELVDKSDKQEMADAVIRLLLLELSFLPAQPLNLPMPTHAVLAEFCHRMRNELALELPTEQAAQQLHMSRATFMRLFQRETGLSFGKWRQQARMLKALTLLAEEKSVLDVALECGYDSPSAFSAMFRRSLGRSPRDYFQSALTA
ncbi:helix-turn-helix transcriptional regulator [Rhizobium sp. P44RR-XXIV]|uniref:AraC family transcriptional regulator n=1 Tax=Rhizobium sp. P44RR-XXIV TaxID=1921145 RepID=UPI0009D3C08B|nr:helix-turn-helix transcriptional regulator [Rhizobium sp. P44RR-XXIV]TIX87976.1 AraC family transcriptional regulator [Rhizobium sp. P44RR-XXIV]